MNTFKEIVYMCADQLKLSSDDTFFTNDHILYLLKKFRGLFLSQRYKDVKKEIPESNYQTICLDLIQVPAINEDVCDGGIILRTRDKIPTLMTIGTTKVYPVGYYTGDITLVSRERMKYIGYNRWLQNVIYCSIAPDGYMYFKSSNPQYLHLENIRVTSIFEDINEVEKLSCEDNKTCDILDSKFPMEESLIPQLIETVVKFMTSGLYKPEDIENNDKDDLSNMMAFIRNNMKSNLQKQIEG